MDKESILKFAKELKTNFFFRLKDETQPAKKEFSYIDLLNILDEVYADFDITKQEIERYNEINIDDIVDKINPLLKDAYIKAVKDEKSIQLKDKK